MDERFSENHMTMNAPRKFHIRTFGCQMNENDSERLAGTLSDLGWIPVPEPESSDLLIVNTCAVREKSVEKLFSFLGRLSLIKQKRPLWIGVAGCVAQLSRAHILERAPYVDFICGPDNYWRIPEIIKKLDKEKKLTFRFVPLYEKFVEGGNDKNGQEKG